MAGGLGSLQALKEGDIGTGCVLAHNMGLGKTFQGTGYVLAHTMGLGNTFQVITFLHTICLSCPENIELRRMLVLGPVNTLYNWKAELARWLPDEGKLPDGTYIEVFLLDESGRTNQLRVQTLESWFKRGGIMCMGYEMYRNLAQGKRVKEKGNRVKEKVLKAKLERYLRDPGPGIVIADEGHMLRNHKSNISKEVARIKTRRRAVLTGSPLQNNLSEYHCMIDFINPGFLGSLAEFKNR
ncbi:SNF2 family N-terminal domain-containing protein [Baffinella frigidus]|nr:SNF2 family N-terminal domain-containing protein [Cryptophyta sp. CCMP2293]